MHIFKLLLLVFIISCSSRKTPDWNYLISDALNECISLEKHGDAKLLFDSDTILVSISRLEQSLVKYERMDLGNWVPSHIDNYKLKYYHSKDITNLSYYVDIGIYQEGNVCLVDLQILPTNIIGDKISIDNEIITMKYEYINEDWKFISLQKWWGGRRK